MLRRPRTSEDFFLFCTYVLEYENYPANTVEVNDGRNTTNPSPPLDSSGSSVNSETTSTHSTSSRDENEKVSGEEDSDEDGDAADSYNNVSCFCGKPFAGRPMIECSICFTWIHLSCAKIKKSNIPDVFHCAMCKSNRKRRSESPTLNTTSTPSTLDKSKRSKKAT